jgi:hypothetical protein
MTQERSHSDTASQQLKKRDEKLTAENWTAMCCLHRLLQLGGQEKLRDELVTRINKIFQPRLGQRRLRIEYTEAAGLTVYCGSYHMVPTMFRFASKCIHQVDGEGNILSTWRQLNTWPPSPT